MECFLFPHTSSFYCPSFSNFPSLGQSSSSALVHCCPLPLGPPVACCHSRQPLLDHQQPSLSVGGHRSYAWGCHHLAVVAIPQQNRGSAWWLWLPPSWSIGGHWCGGPRAMSQNTCSPSPFRSLYVDMILRPLGGCPTTARSPMPSKVLPKLNLETQKTEHALESV